MKKTIIIIMGLMLCPTLLLAQHPEDGVARHAVKTNIISAFAGCPTISYEYRIADHSAVQVDMGGTIFKDPNTALTPHYYFADAHYRFYIVKQGRRHVMPFIGIGAHYTNAWTHLNLFVNNNGWNINTERYTKRDEVLRPFMLVGLKVNIPFGLTIETSVGGRLAYDVDGNSPLGQYNSVTTVFTTSIGWAF